MQYEAPQTLDAALGLLAGATGQVRVLAGGTDIMVQLHMDTTDPDLLVDIKNIPELKAITLSGGAYSIGAATTGAELGENDAVKKLWPGVVEGLELIGSTQVQGRATIGGNLCNASPAADVIPALIAAGAIANVVGPNGHRSVAAEDIPVSPGKTSLAKDEIVVSISLPARANRSGDAYLRFIPRTEMDIAVVGVGISLEIDDVGICKQARVGLGAVAEKALLVPEAAIAIIGTQLGDATMDKLAAVVSAACRPIDDRRGTIEFRTDVAGVIARRTAKIAYDRAVG
jgi:CO/xanthine dehydrogenase FAD-binding subunit